MMVVNVEPDIFVTGSTLSWFSFQAANSVYLIVHLPVVSKKNLQDFLAVSNLLVLSMLFDIFRSTAYY